MYETYRRSRKKIYIFQFNIELFFSYLSAAISFSSRVFVPYFERARDWISGWIWEELNFLLPMISFSWIFFFVFGLSPSKKNETSTKSVILLAACCLEKLKREHFFGSTCDRNDTKQKKKKIHKQKSRVRWALASTRGKNYCQDDKAVLWRRWDETKLHLCFAYYFWYAIQLGKANDSISYEKGNLCAVWQLSK